MCSCKVMVLICFALIVVANGKKTSTSTTTTTSHQTTTTKPTPKPRPTTTTTTSSSTTTTTYAGCTNKDACNYNPDAETDNNSCVFAKQGFNCKGECLSKVDSCGVCGGSGSKKSKCKKPNVWDDNICDDENNTCECGWDGGDCCGLHYLKNSKCEFCECLDPAYSVPAPASCARPCNKPKFKGDGYCDDLNNLCGCNWDGGDCCGVANAYGYCKDCLCLDPDFTYPAPNMKKICGKKCSKSCAKPKWKGDKICDDINNHCGCDWDGGDCCGVKNQYTLCTDCKCRDCDFNHESDECVDKVKGFCLKPYWKGDGKCDDGNNNAGCDWDGGDCCGVSDYQYCKKCECRDCKFKPAGDACVGHIRGFCGYPKFKGDGWCDDSNNNAGCNWDNGDCCGFRGQPTQYKYCKSCKCLDCTFHKIKGDSCVAEIKDGCQTIKWKGDRVCDDGNNNAGCDWDGGDCCGNTNNYKFCKACACRDCTFEPPPEDVCMKGKELKGACAKPFYRGDGYCDDGNNNAWCGWDAGDCCGPSTREKQYSYCKECKCKNCLFVAKKDKCTGEVVKKGCLKPNWFGDGFCDAENNNGGCNWDDGDCCGSKTNMEHCKDDKLCKCLDCKFDPGCKDKTGKCEVKGWKGDGNCDPVNNKCACSWDGGDCCGTDKNYNYCGEQCFCLDNKVKCGGYCGHKTWVKDGHCDLDNNNCGCNWDGGDCCGTSGKENQYAYCKKDCFCKDPQNKAFTASRGNKCDKPCPLEKLKGDGACDDENNICGCQWDGGDCCKLFKKKDRCQVCACVNPLAVPS